MLIFTPFAMPDSCFFDAMLPPLFSLPMLADATLALLMFCCHFPRHMRRYAFHYFLMPISDYDDAYALFCRYAASMLPLPAAAFRHDLTLFYTVAADITR